MKKNLYVISGCNGAGKTTASFTILPDVLECKEFYELIAERNNSQEINIINREKFQKLSQYEKL